MPNICKKSRRVIRQLEFAYKIANCGMLDKFGGGSYIKNLTREALFPCLLYSNTNLIFKSYNARSSLTTEYALHETLRVTSTVISSVYFLEIDFSSILRGLSSPDEFHRVEENTSFPADLPRTRSRKLQTEANCRSPVVTSHSFPL